jgi:transmembrane 9 superfamily protein 2/4
MSSTKTVLPMKFYNLGLCNPVNGKKIEDNLGEILSGERYFQSDYKLKINENEYCKVLCKVDINQGNGKIIKWAINHKYFAKWFLDKLPAAYMRYEETRHRMNKYYNKGIPLGYEEDNEYYIYNHYIFLIQITPYSSDSYNIVGFSILPQSIKQTNEEKCVKSNDFMKNFEQPKQPLFDNDNEILFTYDVYFEYSNITFASRWDSYKNVNKKIHWAGLITSNIVIFILSFVVCCVFYRNIRRDIDLYNQKVTGEEFLDEFGWKQVCNDVFRPVYYNKMLLASLIGTGIQLFSMLFFTLFLGAIGFMNPDRRSNIINYGLILFVFMGMPGGYISAKLYRHLGGRSWLKNAILTSVLFPGVCFGAYTLINFLLILEKSTAAVDFGDIFSLLVLWLCCSSPLVLMGSFFGVKNKGIKVPCKVNALPTVVPPKPWYLKFKFLFFVLGFINFSTIFIELLYFMTSLWTSQIYFLVTYLWISFISLIVVSAESNIMIIFINLCKGDYVWWWKSFFYGGSCAIYVLAYSIYYFFYLRITRFSAMIVYFGIMGMVTIVLFLICGSLTTCITFTFLIKIYSMIKVD